MRIVQWEARPILPQKSSPLWPTHVLSAIAKDRAGAVVASKFATSAKRSGSRIANAAAASLTLGTLHCLVVGDEQGPTDASQGMGRLWATGEGERVGGGGPLFRIALSL